jgi:plastocyanin
MVNRWSRKKVFDHHHDSKPVTATTTRTRTKTAIIKLTVLIVTAAIITSPLLLLNGLTAHAQSLAGTTFPPPVFSTIRSKPAYVVNIPFSSEGKPVFEPKEISIPTGMTVIWFNNDLGQHSITTLNNSTYSPPEAMIQGSYLE